MTHLKRETLFQFGHCAVSSSLWNWLNFYLSRLLLVSSVKWKHPFGSFRKKTSCKEIKWFPWNYWPFITNNAIAITSVLLHQYNGFDVSKMRARERKRFVKKMKDKHNSNTKHLIAYSIQLLLSIFFFALSWRSLAMTHAVNTPGTQLISFWVNNSVCKLIIYYKNRIFLTPLIDQTSNSLRVWMKFQCQPRKRKYGRYSIFHIDCLQKFKNRNYR